MRKMSRGSEREREREREKKRDHILLIDECMRSRRKRREMIVKSVNIQCSSLYLHLDETKKEERKNERERKKSDDVVGGESSEE